MVVGSILSGIALEVETVKNLVLEPAVDGVVVERSSLVYTGGVRGNAEVVRGCFNGKLKLLLVVSMRVKLTR